MQKLFSRGAVLLAKVVFVVTIFVSGSVWAVAASGTATADPDKLNVPLFGGYNSVSQFTTAGGDGGTLVGFATIVYKLTAIIITALAVLMIIVGGIEIMIGGASAESVDAGKERIFGALSGVALLYSIGFILHTLLPFFFTS